MNLGPTEQLAHTTVRIQCDLASGGTSTGTGFFYELDREGDHSNPVIVTNKHVVNGATVGRFSLTLTADGGGPDVGNVRAFEIDHFGGRWILHPDPNVDLCVMPIASFLDDAARAATRFFYVSFNSDMIPDATDLDGMVGLESIVMIGYPNGLWDETNNLPIFRKGVLATNYKHDWKGKKVFVIDAACFPGSSGSPVMLFDVGSYTTRRAIVVGSRIRLLGVLYALCCHTIQGEVMIVPAPAQQRLMSVATMPNNLGIVIKAEQLRAFEGIRG